jgi:hypothetical protein
MDDGYPVSEEEFIEEHNQYLDDIDEYCNNCGRKHEGRLVETHLDGDNNPIEIVIFIFTVYIDREASTECV